MTSACARCGATLQPDEHLLCPDCRLGRPPHGLGERLRAAGYSDPLTPVECAQTRALLRDHLTLHEVHQVRAVLRELAARGWQGA